MQLKADKSSNIYNIPIVPPQLITLAYSLDWFSRERLKLLCVFLQINLGAHSCLFPLQLGSPLLVRKHPDPSPATPMSLINPSTTTLPSCHPIIFDCLDGDLIRHTAVRIEGSAGPSGVDALGWRCLCTSFRTTSSNLCHSLASVARRISTSFIDPDALQPLLNCHLIALNKNPGVRPIGIGETSRRIIAKAVLFVVKQDIMDAAVCLQLCAGQRAGCKAAVHAMREIFADKDTEGILLVDASNAFNSLNRRAALLNMFHLCPLWRPFLPTLTALLLTCSLMVHLYCHRKVQHRVISWPCPCMLLASSQLFDG